MWQHEICTSPTGTKKRCHSRMSTPAPSPTHGKAHEEKYQGKHQSRADDPSLSSPSPCLGQLVKSSSIRPLFCQLLGNTERKLCFTTVAQVICRAAEEDHKTSWRKESLGQWSQWSLLKRLLLQSRKTLYSNFTKGSLVFLWTEVSMSCLPFPKKVHTTATLYSEGEG